MITRFGTVITRFGIVIDPTTGQAREVELFVATLGASNLFHNLLRVNTICST